MKIPCEKCITLAICRATTVDDPEAGEAGSIFPLLRKCLLLRNYVKPCTHLINPPSKPRSSIYKVRKANKILLDIYKFYNIKVVADALYQCLK